MADVVLVHQMTNVSERIGRTAADGTIRRFMALALKADHFRKGSIASF